MIREDPEICMQHLFYTTAFKIYINFLNHFVRIFNLPPNVETGKRKTSHIFLGSFEHFITHREAVCSFGARYLEEKLKVTFSPWFFFVSSLPTKNERKVTRKIAGYHFSVTDKRFWLDESRYDRVYGG